MVWQLETSQSSNCRLKKVRGEDHEDGHIDRIDCVMMIWIVYMMWLVLCMTASMYGLVWMMWVLCMMMPSTIPTIYMMIWIVWVMYMVLGIIASIYMMEWIVWNIWFVCVCAYIYIVCVCIYMHCVSDCVCVWVVCVSAYDAEHHSRCYECIFIGVHEHHDSNPQILGSNFNGF